MTPSWVLFALALSSCGRDALSEGQRKEVQAMIAADHAEQTRKADEAERELTDRRLRAAADRGAASYELTADQKQSLLDVLRQQCEKTQQASAELATSVTGEEMGDKVQRFSDDLESWRLGELTARLGPEVAQRINREPFWLAAWPR